MPRKLTETARVNIARVVNTKNAKKLKRNGREVIVVPSATMPSDIVMNRIKYPADEIKKSFASLNRSPAPLNHPMVNGKFVSARDPEGLNIGWIGAWNENARFENGKVYLDKIIDVERANQSDEGKRVLEAIEKGEPIHTSTGIFCHLKFVENNEEFDATAHDLEFDHDAILLDFEGAATPEDGVGIFVNSSGDLEDVTVINSIWEEADREMDWAIESIVRALDKKAKIPLFERVKAAITEAFSSGAETTANEKEAEMSKEELDKLSSKVDALAESVGKIGEAVTTGVTNALAEALKPLIDAQATTVANQKAAEEKEQGELIDKIVKANLLDEAVAKEMPLATLRALAANIKEPQKAAPVRPGTVQANQNATSAFKLPSAKEA